jgi:hypothetical protein
VTTILQRPAEPTHAPTGLMRKEQFQTGYVTNDLDRACELLRAKYGIGEFSFLEGEMGEGGSIRVAFAWVGGNMYEIIDAKGGKEAEFYTSRLPADGSFALVFHHLGYMIHSDEEWAAVKAEIAEREMNVALDVATGGFMDAIYIEAPELGHYLEYLYPAEGGLQFFGAVPAN